MISHATGTSRGEGREIKNKFEFVRFDVELEHSFGLAAPDEETP